MPTSVRSEIRLSGVVAFQGTDPRACRDLFGVGAFAQFDLFYPLGAVGHLVGRNTDFANVLLGLFKMFFEIADALIDPLDVD